MTMERAYQILAKVSPQRPGLEEAQDLGSGVAEAAPAPESKAQDEFALLPAEAEQQNACFALQELLADGGQGTDLKRAKALPMARRLSARVLSRSANIIAAEAQTAQMRAERERAAMELQDAESAGLHLAEKVEQAKAKNANLRAVVDRLETFLKQRQETLGGEVFGLLKHWRSTDKEVLCELGLEDDYCPSRNRWADAAKAARTAAQEDARPSSGKSERSLKAERPSSSKARSRRGSSRTNSVESMSDRPGSGHSSTEKLPASLPPGRAAGLMVEDAAACEEEAERTKTRIHLILGTVLELQRQQGERRAELAELRRKGPSLRAAASDTPGGRELFQVQCRLRRVQDTVTRVAGAANGILEEVDSWASTTQEALDEVLASQVQCGSDATDVDRQPRWEPALAEWEDLKMQEQEAVEEEPLGIETEHLASTVPEQLDLEDTAQNPLTQGEALAQPRHDLSEPLLSAPETLEPAVKHDDQPLDVNQDQRWEQSGRSLQAPGRSPSDGQMDEFAIQDVEATQLPQDARRTLEEALQFHSQGAGALWQLLSQVTALQTFAQAELLEMGTVVTDKRRDFYLLADSRFAREWGWDDERPDPEPILWPLVSPYALDHE
ncbi:unnamed protein product [Effrenium voratum]|nr:unnamed protein product [Effrenium voratum]